MARPPKYESAEELAVAIAAYFLECKEANLMPNKAGLCVSLDITKETYNQYKKKFSDPVKGIDPILKAERHIENAWVQRLAANAATGAIFYLKNAFSADYRDRTETDITTANLPFNLTIVQKNESKHS